MGGGSAGRRDTSNNKTNNSEWVSDNAKTTFHTLGSKELHPFDTTISTIHRKLYSQPFYKDLGNLGSPSINLQYQIQNPIGFSLGYNLYTPFRFNIDSLKYYNTDRPFSVFTYQMGTKLEQTAQIFHTQNINRQWNFAFAYRKTTSPGQYLIQRNNDDNAFLTTEYTSKRLRYKVNFALAYNKQQHDENGGILSDTFLNNTQYADRRSIPVNYYTTGYSNTRSPVTSLHRDLNILLNHGYTFGRIDTLYNEDSTQFETKLKARFKIGHQMKVTNQRFEYKDLRPDSNRYSAFFQRSFAEDDSVFTQQNWLSFDNQFTINGILGKADNPITFTGGVGNRVDNFSTNYITETTSDNNISNYLVAQIHKEALKEKQWALKANTQLFLTGAATGNFILAGSIAKNTGGLVDNIQVGFHQQLNNAPYSFTYYRNQYWQRANSFDPENTIAFYGRIYSNKRHFDIGARNYVISNYLYFNASQLPDQYKSTFSLMQVWLKKKFYFGAFTIDNELLYQEYTDAPINLPKLQGRHQFAIETKIFQKQLQIATGIELRYHSAYHANGYSPFSNQFYLQNSYRVNNAPDASFFFNFRIKRFRAFFMLDQLSQLWGKNQIIAEGYAAPNTMFRLGFNWGLVN